MKRNSKYPTPLFSLMDLSVQLGRSVVVTQVLTPFVLLASSDNVRTKLVNLRWQIGHFSEQINGAQDHLEYDPLPLLRRFGSLKERIIKSNAKLYFPLVRLITPDLFKAWNGCR